MASVTFWNDYCIFLLTPLSQVHIIFLSSTIVFHLLTWVYSFIPPMSSWCPVSRTHKLKIQTSLPSPHTVFFSFLSCWLMVKHPEVWMIDKRPNKHSPANGLVRRAVTVQEEKPHFLSYSYCSVWLTFEMRNHWYDSCCCNYKSHVDTQIEPVPGMISAKCALKSVTVPSAYH